MNLDTFTFECFIALAETGSFTKAAQKVGRTQSAISQQIHKLETMLDKPLFIRGKLCSLTAEGSIFLSYARQIFALHRESIDRCQEPELAGEIKLGLPEDFTHLYLSHVLADFSRLHPRVILSIECDLTLHLFKKFKDKKLDIALVKMNRPEDFPNSLDIWSEPLHWVGNTHLFYINQPIPLIVAPQPCVYRSAAIKSLEQAGLTWRIAFSSLSYSVTIAAVKAGMGITVMPHTMIPHTLEIVESPLLPALCDTHVSLLKHQADHGAINNLEKFLLKKLNIKD